MSGSSDWQRATTAGKEGKDAQTNFAYKTSSTQVLVRQHVIDALRDGGADFALLPVRAGYALISHQEAGRFGFVGPAVADHGLGDTVHIILPKQENALRRSVNQAIAEIRADGTGHRIVRRHFPVNLD